MGNSNDCGAAHSDTDINANTEAADGYTNKHGHADNTDSDRATNGDEHAAASGNGNRESRNRSGSCHKRAA